jgi:hypothetical protein
MANAISPVLLNVIASGALVVPMLRLAKAPVVGVTAITGAIPRPVSAIVVALPEPSLVILTLALLAPRLVGVKITGIVQLSPGATDEQL